MMDLGCGTLPFASFLVGIHSIHGVDLSVDYVAYCLKQTYYTLAKSQGVEINAVSPKDANWIQDIIYTFECAPVDRAIEAWKRKYNFVFCNFLLSYLNARKLDQLLSKIYNNMMRNGIFFLKGK